MNLDCSILIPPRDSLSFWVILLTQCILWSAMEEPPVSIPKPEDGSHKQS